MTAAEVTTTAAVTTIYIVSGQEENVMKAVWVQIQL